MMYLSRLTPNLRAPEVRRDLHDAYQMHRTLSRATKDYEKDRILWRQEIPRAHHQQPTILVQTQQEPDWSYLDERAQRNYLLKTAEVKQVALQFHQGQVLSFRLCANPTAITTFPNGKKKRLAITEPEAQQKWLRRKLEAAGTQPLSAHLLRDAWLNTAKGERRIILYSATFEGKVQVLEPDNLLSAVQQGIGRAKGFGMGLLSLAPA